MVLDIIKDSDFLHQKSEKATPKDFHIINDLLDTVNNASEICCGLSAIQVGIPKKMLIAKRGSQWIAIINPIIVKKSLHTFNSKEGCMSVEGFYIVKRHREILLIYTDINNKQQTKRFKGFTAQVIQHEIDHLNGVIISDNNVKVI